MRTQNVTAVVAIANIVKSSLGPVGLDKVRQARQEMRRAPISPARVRATLDPGRRWEGL